MPMTKKQAKALKAWRECDESFTEAAKFLNTSRQNATKQIKAALAWEEASDGHKSALESTGLDMTDARHGWRRVEQPDGSMDSVFWKAPDREDVDPIDMVETMKEAMKTIAKSRPRLKPPLVNPNLITVFPIADLHMGLLTDQEEVGVDWDTKIALQVFQDTFGQLVTNTPSSKTAILAQLGDLTHNDDQRNVTPQSGHQLDVDTRYFMIVRRALAVMVWGIELLRKKYKKVIYRGCRGNHDMTTHIGITLALSERYRNIPEVEIIDSASEFYAHEFGKNMFFFHHGDRTKPERLLGFIANEYKEIWGRTDHRVAFSGHVHHEWVKEMAGMLFRSMGTIIPRDVHAFSHAYGSQRCLMSLTYDKKQGEVATARINV